VTVNLALELEAAVVALVVVTTALGTCLALRALPAGMPAELHRLARWCGTALGTGLGAVLVLAVLVQSSGLDAPRTVVLEALLGASLAAMVAEHAAAARWLRTRWLCTPGAVAPAPAPVVLPSWLRRLPPPAVLAAVAALCAAVLLTASTMEPWLPRWTALFGIAAAGQGLGIALVAAPRLIRRGAR
jgi:hypothetical protein